MNMSSLVWEATQKVLKFGLEKGMNWVLFSLFK